jgi:hypothetical protein
MRWSKRNSGSAGIPINRPVGPTVPIIPPGKGVKDTNDESFDPVWWFNTNGSGKEGNSLVIVMAIESLSGIVASLEPTEVLEVDSTVRFSKSTTSALSTIADLLILSAFGIGEEDLWTLGLDPELEVGVEPARCERCERSEREVWASCVFIRTTRMVGSFKSKVGLSCCWYFSIVPKRKVLKTAKYTKSMVY